MLPTNHIQSSVYDEVLEPVDKEVKLGFKTEIELDILEELIINSTHVPLTDFLVVDRAAFLDRLNQVKKNLPSDLATASEIVSCQQQIVSEAECYADSVIESAKEKANQILHDSSILRQAELDGAKLRLKTEHECEHLKQKTLAEVEQLRRNAIAESQAIQTGADEYADSVLGDIEARLRQMLNVIQNGRQQLDKPSTDERR